MAPGCGTLAGLGRALRLSKLAAGPPLDLAIIGGGINGCGIAEEAAARGLRVALFEADDFGFGTTWRSTKLIHGGLRYLEHGDVRLVFESLRERAWLLKTRPYLVKPQRFVLPILPWTRRPAWQLRLGLAAYDLLSLYRGVPKHSRLDDSRLHNLAPYLPAETRGGFTFYDARVIAPERLALELALEARAQGAFIANHARVTRIAVDSGKVNGLEVEHGGTLHLIPANAVVNAAGPWVDAVNALGDLPSTQLLGVTRGAHIVIPRPDGFDRDAIFSTAREDGRVFFMVPQEDLLLIGTTDDRYDGAPADIRPTSADIDYLLAEARNLMPGTGLRRDQVLYAYAGLRPLQKVSGGPEAAISRRHEVIEHTRRGGAAGMYSVVGGKLSTFRPLAGEVVGRLHPAQKRAPREEPIAPGWADTLRASGLPLPVKQHLRIHGPAIADVIAAGREIICGHAHAISGEVLHAARAEQVETLSDIMLRRTGISWSSCRGLCCHEAVARLAGEVLGWDAAAREAQVRAFEADVAYHLPAEDMLVP
ncbi:MAG: FAD-dependent oxidoreductase [Anaerolinea sp.]|nr:FAD-dependent oxidoreductase [Anaerolinea sp.]